MDDITQRTGAPLEDVLRLSSEIVAAYVSRNALPADQVAAMLRTVHSALSGLGREPSQTAVSAAKPKPAVPVSRSVHHDYIVCLEDGKKLKMLKRYLRARYDMSPEDYRRRWGLPPDYPMVAPLYADRRSSFAKQMGLGKGVRGRKAAP